MRAATHRWHSAVTAAAEGSALIRLLEEAKHKARVGMGAAGGVPRRSTCQVLIGLLGPGEPLVCGLNSLAVSLYRKGPKTLHSE